MPFPQFPRTSTSEKPDSGLSGEISMPSTSTGQSVTRKTDGLDAVPGLLFGRDRYGLQILVARSRDDRRRRPHSLRESLAKTSELPGGFNRLLRRRRGRAFSIERKHRRAAQRIRNLAG